MIQMNKEEAAIIMSLAIGRLFKLGSRPAQPGDIEQYEKCRRVALECGEVLGIDPNPPSMGHHRPGWNFGNAVLD